MQTGLKNDFAASRRKNEKNEHRSSYLDHMFYEIEKPRRFVYMTPIFPTQTRLVATEIWYKDHAFLVFITFWFHVMDIFYVTVTLPSTVKLSQMNQSGTHFLKELHPILW